MSVMCVVYPFGEAGGAEADGGSGGGGARCY